MDNNENADKHIIKYTRIITMIWTILLFCLIILITYAEKRNARDIISKEARAYILRDQALYEWSASHGGLYIGIDSSSSNGVDQYLNDNNISADNNKSLKLINHPFMIPHLRESYERDSGIIIQIKSLNPLNPENFPDHWEKAALLKFNDGVDEINEYQIIDGKLYLRLIKPLEMKTSCLKCHTQDKDISNNLAGGIVVSVPVSEAFRVADRRSINYAATLILIWLSGVLFLSYGSRKIEKHIFERDWAEGALRENQNLLLSIAENFPNSYLSIIESDYKIGFTSGQEFKERNLDPQFFIGSTLEEVFDKDAPLISEYYEKTFAGEYCSFELYRDFQYQFYRTVPLYAANNTIPRILVVVENITDKKREELLRESHIKLVEYSANHSAVELLSRTLDELEFLTRSQIGFYHFVDDDQENLHLQTWSSSTLANNCTAEGFDTHYPISRAGVWVDCIKEGGPVIHNDYENLEHKKGYPDGHVQVTRELVVPVKRHNKFVAILGVGNKEYDYDELDVKSVKQLAELAWEIVVRKKSEEALKESEEKFRSVIQQSNDAIYIIYNNKFDLVNPRFMKLTGISEEELENIDANFLDIIIYNNQEESNSRTNFKSINESSNFVEFSIIHNSGSIYEVQASISEIEYKDGKAILGILRDISQQKSLEAQLRQSQKMESVGHLAGGIAHDFNNLLTPIIGNAEMSLMGMDSSNEHYQTFFEINEAAIRAADLIRQLLAFSRKQVLDIKTINLNELLMNFLSVIRRTIREDVELILNFDDNIGLIEVDVSQIEQIVMNMFVNAQDAMPEGGTISITTSSRELDDLYTETHADVRPGDYVLLAISDTGTGMDEKTTHKVFDPFYTTKEIGKGTGLGLSTVYGIIKQHGGEIYLYSKPGMGSTFKIYLPVVEGSISVHKESLLHDNDLLGDETIMIVEDQQEVRLMAAKILEMYGYKIYQAESGDDAIVMIKNGELAIDLLLTDVIMPRMNGRELYKRLTEDYPDLKVAYMSGYTQDVISHHGILEENTNFIQKPLAVKTLLRKVKEVLKNEKKIKH